MMKFYFQDDDLVAFRDIKPATQHHYLITSKEHIRDAKTLTPQNLPLGIYFGNLFFINL